MNYNNTPFPKLKYYDMPIYNGVDTLKLTNGIYYVERITIEDWRQNKYKNEIGKVYFARRCERNKYQIKFIFFSPKGIERIYDMPNSSWMTTPSLFKITKMPSVNKILYNLKI